MAKKKASEQEATPYYVKRWYNSKAVWLGVLGIAAAVFEALNRGATWQAAALAGIGAAGVGVRLLTDSKIIW